MGAIWALIMGLELKHGKWLLGVGGYSIRLEGLLLYIHILLRAIKDRLDEGRLPILFNRP